QGEFHRWVRSRLMISPRLAQTYIQIADAQSSAREPLPENVSIDRFLKMLRAARKPKPEPPTEPDLGSLGTLRIGTSGTDARLESEAFASVSAVDRRRKLLVCRAWDSRAKAALARG